MPGTPTHWTSGGATPAPPPRKNYQEATTRKGRFKRRGRVVRDDGEMLLVAFYATGEELVQASDVVLSWRYPS